MLREPQWGSRKVDAKLQGGVGGVAGVTGCHMLALIKSECRDMQLNGEQEKYAEDRAVVWII